MTGHLLFLAKKQRKITPVLTCLGRQEQAARRLQPLGALDVRFDTHKSPKTAAEFFSRVRLSDASRGMSRSGVCVREAAVSFPQFDDQNFVESGDVKRRTRPLRDAKWSPRASERGRAPA